MDKKFWDMMFIFIAVNKRLSLQVNLFLLSLILQPAASACKGNASPVLILLDSAIFGQKIAITSSKSSQQRFSLSNMISF